jgi:EAL domain-containing protein (putative c-di-GMP-specific phosphodiesterase class I)
MSRLAAMRRDSTALAAPSRTDNLALSFERALHGCSFVYQPIVSVSERRIIGYEAFVRCAEPSLATPPDLFAAAEELGRVGDLTRTLRRQVVRPLDSQGGTDTLLFVNLHLRDLEDEDLFDPASPLAQVAERVVLELAERESLAKVDELKDKVVRLRRLGFRVALDDVGLSYSGLSSFAQIEPSIVKFDMSLVRGLPVLPIKRRVVASLVELCNDLGITTVAEGVEAEDEAAALEKIGCRWQQGYFHAKPGPPFPTVTW